MTLREAIQASPYDAALCEMPGVNITYYIERGDPETGTGEWIVTMAHGAMPAEWVGTARELDGVDRWLGADGASWLPVGENGEVIA